MDWKTRGTKAGRFKELEIAVLVVTQSLDLQQLNSCTQEKTGAIVPFFAIIE